MTVSTKLAPLALDELCVNTLRFLAVDMVQKAESGHPGLPLGSASMAYALWDRSLIFNPRGAHQLDRADDYPDFIIPLAHAVAAREIERGLALCGSGVGASIAANKVAGVRAGLIHDIFSPHQGVEDDNMNVFCLGGNVIGAALALELIEKFLSARFSGAPRHRRRIAKVQALERAGALI